jgi:hypothetical protein
MALTPTIKFTFNSAYFLRNLKFGGSTRISPGSIGLSDKITITKKPLYYDGIKLSESVSVLLNYQQPEDGVELKELVALTHVHWLSHITPTLDIFQYDPEEMNPSGCRHIPSGCAAFQKNIADDGIVDFGLITIAAGTSIRTTETRALVIKPAAQSGVFNISNIKVWQSATGPFTPADLTVNFDPTATWTQERAVASGDGTLLSTTLPSTQNLYRWDGSAFIDGPNKGGTFEPNDNNTSQFCYLSVNVSSAYTEGQYGPAQSTNAVIRFTYDYGIGGYHPESQGAL